MHLDFPGIMEAVLRHGPLTIWVQEEGETEMTPRLTSANAKELLKLVNMVVLRDDVFDIKDAHGKSVLGR